MPTLKNDALYRATYEAAMDTIRLGALYGTPAKTIDLAAGQMIYRFSSSKFSDGTYEGSLKLYKTVEKDVGNRWSGLAPGGAPSGVLGQYFTLEADKEANTLFSELFHYMPSEKEVPDKPVKHFQFALEEANDGTRARSNAVTDPAPASGVTDLAPAPGSHWQMAEQLNFMFAFTMSEKKTLLDVQLPTTPDDDNFLVTKIFNLAKGRSEALFAGTDCMLLYTDKEDASFCRAIGNAALEQTAYNGILVTSARDTRSTSVVFKGRKDDDRQYDFLKFLGRSSFFIEKSGGKFTKAGESIADMEYNDDFHAGRNPIEEKKARDAKELAAGATIVNTLRGLRERAQIRVPIWDGKPPNLS